MKKKYCEYCGAELGKKAMFGEGAIKVMKELKQKGVIKDFVVGGGVAAIAHVEPITTKDLDIIVETIATGIGFLQPIFDYLIGKGYEFEKIVDEAGNAKKGEHIVIEGTPTQFIPITNSLLEEAVNNPVMKSIGGIDVKVLKAEYLIAMYTQIFRPKDQEKLIRLTDQAEVDEGLLKQILQKYNLSGKYNKFVKIHFGGLND